MTINLLFSILLIFIVIRTTAYGIYCIRNSGIIGGISVFVLDAAVIVLGYALLISGKVV